MRGPDISVVVCTHNREEYLDLALTSLLKQDVDEADYEVIVIDNGSDRATADVVRKHADLHENLRCVAEPRIGLSISRNRGIHEATGSVIAFIDDDAVAARGWVRALRDGFARHPQCAAAGGPARLVWPGDERPRWLSDALARVYSYCNYGDHDRALAFPESPVGTNMAFRRNAFERVGDFDDRLGRKGRRLVSGEEQNLFYRLAVARMNVCYFAEALVNHHVMPDRVSRRWFLRRNFYEGWTARIVAAGDPEVRPLPPAFRGRERLVVRLRARSLMEIAGRVAQRSGYAAARFSQSRAGNDRTRE